MSKEVIRKAQLAQLKIMEQIHRVCIAKNIKYYIIGGTALGAVRHGGFIPWDPDIDIAMPRPDYDRFLSECRNDMGDICSIESYHNNVKHDSPHALVILNGSVLMNRHDKYDNRKRNIYVDIFPLDVAPENVQKQIEQANRIKRIKTFLERKKSDIYNHNGFFIILLKKIVRILFSGVSFQRLNKMLDDEMKRYSYPFPKSDFLLCSMASHYSYNKQCMPSEIYGAPTLIKFEDHDFFGPQKIDEYLTRIYKDYMKLPSIEEQNRWYSYLDKVEII